MQDSVAANGRKAVAHAGRGSGLWEEGGGTCGAQKQHMGGRRWQEQGWWRAQGTTHQAAQLRGRRAGHCGGGNAGSREKERESRI